MLISFQWIRGYLYKGNTKEIAIRRDTLQVQSLASREIGDMEVTASTYWDRLSGERFVICG